MIRFARTLAVFVIGIGVPVAAWAQATTQFDGTYVGVSATMFGLTAESDVRAMGLAQKWCPKFTPRPLRVQNGVARTPWRQGTDGLQGDVTPQGVIVMRDGYGTRIDGQIDAAGVIRARGGAACQYTLIWQKRVPAADVSVQSR